MLRSVWACAPIPLTCGNALSWRWTTVSPSEKPLGGSLVLGHIVRMHVDDEIIDASYKIDADKLRAIGRMGGPEYTRTRDRFAMVRP